MRFFGYEQEDWEAEGDGDGDYDDDSWERERQRWNAAVKDYYRYLDGLSSFSAELFKIADPSEVDDALVARVVYRPAKRRLDMTLRCGSTPDGYYDLELHYEGVEIAEHELQELARAARGAGPGIGRRYWHDASCHEFGLLPDGRIEHGFLFHGSMEWIATNQWKRIPSAMFHIRCDSLAWERVRRPDRNLPRVRDRFRMLA